MSPDVLRPEALDEATLLNRAQVLATLSSRLDQFATQQQRPTDELRARVRDILTRYADLSARTSVKPGTPLARYFDARLQVVRASVRARLVS
jgi:hypothetical protein